jgi:hypothetical protein
MSLVDSEKAKDQWAEEVVREGKEMVTNKNVLGNWTQNSKNS